MEQSPELARVLRDGRHTRTQNSLLLPLLVDGRAIGVLEVEDAPAGDLASGGMQYWQSLADVVAAALDEATSFAELARAEARFRSLVEQIPAVTYLDRAGSGEPIYCSPQLETLFGIPPPSGWTAMTAGPGGSTPTTARSPRSYDAAVADGQPYYDEYRLIDPDGRVRWVCDEAVTVTDREGTEVVPGRDLRHHRPQAGRAALTLPPLRDAESRYRTWSSSCRWRSTSTPSTRPRPRSTTAPRTPRSPATPTSSGSPTPIFSRRSSTPTTGTRCWPASEAHAAHGDPFAATTGSSAPTAARVWVRDESVVVERRGGRRSTGRATCWTSPAGKQAEERLAHLAYHDSLTGLPNRAMFQRAARRRARPRGRALGTAVAVLYVDLDDFKLVNDSLRPRRRRRAAVRGGAAAALGRPSPRCGRPPGRRRVPDPGRRPRRRRRRAELDIAEIARGVAEQLQEALSHPFLRLRHRDLLLGGSVGISLYPADAEDAESLLKHADIAMYKAKDSGRDACPPVRPRRRRCDGAAVHGRPAAAGHRARASSSSTTSRWSTCEAAAWSAWRRSSAGTTASAA